MRDPYEVLGVPKDATADQIKKAFRKLSHQHHPDKGGESAKFKEINQAYQILSDPQKRAQFDRFGAAGPAGAGGPGGQGFGGFDFNFGGGGGFGDIFEDLFSSAFATVQAEVQISPAQAVLGAVIPLRFENEELKLEVPAGAQDGQAMVFRGKGRQTRRGRGDLQIVLRVVMPRRLSRRERELWEELKRLSES